MSSVVKENGDGDCVGGQQKRRSETQTQTQTQTDTETQRVTQTKEMQEKEDRLVELVKIGLSHGRVPSICIGIVVFLA